MWTYEIDTCPFVSPRFSPLGQAEIALLRKLCNPHIIEYIGCGSWDNSSEEAAERSIFLVQVRGWN